MKLARIAARDNARTCMQWDNSPNAGFTTGKPWFVVNKNYTEINVSDALNDENSILNFYKKLIAFRKKNPVVIYGDFKLHYKNSKKLFVYERNYQGKKLFVAINFSETDTKIKVPYGIDLTKGELSLSNYPVADKNELVTLRPYEVRVYLI